MDLSSDNAPRGLSGVFLAGPRNIRATDKNSAFSVYFCEFTAPKAVFPAKHAGLAKPHR
jgi:hypothetical protein